MHFNLLSIHRSVSLGETITFGAASGAYQFVGLPNGLHNAPAVVPDKAQIGIADMQVRDRAH